MHGLLSVRWDGVVYERFNAGCRKMPLQLLPAWCGNCKNVIDVVPGVVGYRQCYQWIGYATDVFAGNLSAPRVVGVKVW